MNILKLNQVRENYKDYEEFSSCYDAEEHLMYASKYIEALESENKNLLKCFAEELGFK